MKNPGIFVAWTTALRTLTLAVLLTSFLWLFLIPALKVLALYLSGLLMSGRSF